MKNHYKNISKSYNKQVNKQNSYLNKLHQTREEIKNNKPIFYGNDDWYTNSEPCEVLTNFLMESRIFLPKNYTTFKFFTNNKFVSSVIKEFVGFVKILSVKKNWGWLDENKDFIIIGDQRRVYICSDELMVYDDLLYNKKTCLHINNLLLNSILTSLTNKEYKKFRGIKIMIGPTLEFMNNIEVENNPKYIYEI